eukprot:11398182-Karenia_brevis.AAC.1
MAELNKMLADIRDGKFNPDSKGRSHTDESRGPPMPAREDENISDESSDSVSNYSDTDNNEQKYSIICQRAA